MNFWNLNKNEKPENTAHGVGLEFGLRPSTVGPAQWLFQPGRPDHSAWAWRAEHDHRIHGHHGGAAGMGSLADPGWGLTEAVDRRRGAVAVVGGSVSKQRGSSGGRWWRWKAPAASEGRGEGEGQCHLAEKGLEEVLTEDGGQRWRRLRCSGGSIGLSGGHAAP
jgi:hypothetical protein